MTMKSRVFTDRERKRLRRWLDSEVEDDTTVMLFVEMRRNAPRLMADLELFFQVRRKLLKAGRWKGTLRGK